VCLSCWSELRPLRPPFCPLCALPFPRGTIEMIGGARSSALDEPCGSCLADPPPFSSARALSEYDGTTRAILHAFKFGGQPGIARTLGRLMAACWLASPGVAGPDPIVVPVPQRFWKERARGFNPAGLLARSLAGSLGLPVETRVLRKTRRTADQALLASAGQRQVNVAGAFSVSRLLVGRIHGCRVMLVDDILTTGATAKACARALLDAGARDVVVLAAARPPRDSSRSRSQLV
jgi:ComF family protein